MWGEYKEDLRRWTERRFTEHTREDGFSRRYAARCRPLYGE